MTVSNKEEQEHKVTENVALILISVIPLCPQELFLEIKILSFAIHYYYFSY